MKLKKLILAGVLAALTFCAASCGNNNDRPGGTSGTTTTPPTSATTTTTTSMTTTADTMDGEYDAGKDGIVTEDGEEDMPDSGSPADSSDTESSVKKDEAAFASSYIGTTALKETKIGWGLGKERDGNNRPIDAVRAEEKYSALGGRFLTSEGKICLTFDEGYENGQTAAILDTLKEKQVKAVFFVTYDYCRTAPELVRRMIDEGHVVGNHTWSHPSLPDCSQKEVWSEVTQLHQYVKDEFGYEMTLFRFPMGEFSERTLDDVHNLGYTSLFWSFAYADWDPNKPADPAEALAKIKDSTHSGIYLLHAVSETNAKILAPLIDFWHSQGYEVGASL